MADDRVADDCVADDRVVDQTDRPATRSSNQLHCRDRNMNYGIEHRTDLGVSQFMKRFAGWILGIYALYLFKSAIGINLSPHYSAWSWLKLPIAPILNAHNSDH